MDDWLDHPKNENYPENDQFLLNNSDHPFDLDDINFIVPESLDPSTKAYPPLESFQNTPALPPTRKESALFQSPILPGQNDRSYNEEHYFHKQKQRSHLHVRPDAVYTPLVSPAGTPQHHHQQNAPQTASFEPLTSPALNAQRPPTDRRRPLSATFANDDASASSSCKRRTPHSTPNMPPISSSSSSSKPKKSPSLRRPLHTFEPLPDSSYDSAPVPHSRSHSANTTPMLPPLGKVLPIDKNDSTISSADPASVLLSQPHGPGTLMGFTMNRLAESQSNTSASPSPNHSAHNSARSSVSGAKSLIKHETSLSEPSPALDPQTDNSLSSKREKPPTKKASHKIAEQGRRNRMNQAVHDLSALIPASYHEQVSVPSKATTVELASSYIQHLNEEISALKAQLRHSQLS